jgi:hypothetical protein
VGKDFVLKHKNMIPITSRRKTGKSTMLESAQLAYHRTVIMLAGEKKSRIWKRVKTQFCI